MDVSGLPLGCAFTPYTCQLATPTQFFTNEENSQFPSKYVSVLVCVFFMF